MTESLQENLEEIELILQECGAETVRTIKNARFPPPPGEAPARQSGPAPVLSGKCPVNVVTWTMRGEEVRL